MMRLQRALVRNFVLLIFVLASAASPAPAQTLPAPWKSADIGQPALAGSSAATSGVFTLDAAGADIWNSSDQFHFLYQAVTGDVDVIARIDDVTFTHAWAKAGVMIRADLTPGSAHAYALASAGRGLAFQRRTQAFASTLHTAGEAAPPPRWVRLVRQGSRVTAYTSATGTAWTSVGSSTIAFGATAYVGIAVTSHNTAARTTARVSNVSVTRLGLPAGQASADIGAPAIRGTASHANGTYTIEAAGSDIWSSADQFHFVYQQFNGDGEVVARVASMSNTHAWAKAGVMIRETLAADSRHASALITAGKGYAFQRRLEPAAWSSHTAGTGGTAPAWLRLVRAGTTFTAFQSLDGATWTQIASDTINMGTSVYAGIAVTSHNTSALTRVVADNFVVRPAAPPANQPPLVALTAPAAGATYVAPATIAVAASASDPEGRLAAVEFYNGTTLLQRDATAPYSFSWTSVPAGTYALSAVAFDGDGESTTSAAVAVTVSSAPNQRPSVNLTSPANGAQYTEPATVTLTASASDPEGRLSSVQFYAGTTLLGTAATAPYTLTWSPVAAGTYTLTAVARDADGGSTTSGAISIAVRAPAPRYAVFTASADHDTGVTSYVLEVFASGANPDTATPIASSDLGKPVPASNGDITVDRSAFFEALSAGTYVATVSAVGPGGRGRSTPVTFTR